VFELHLRGRLSQDTPGGSIIGGLQQSPQPPSHILVANGQGVVAAQQGAQVPFDNVGWELQVQAGRERGIGLRRVHDPVKPDPAGFGQRGRCFVHDQFEQFLVMGGLGGGAFERRPEEEAPARLVKFAQGAQHQTLAAGEGSAGGLRLEAHAQGFAGHELAHGFSDGFLRLARRSPTRGTGRRPDFDAALAVADELFATAQQVLRVHQLERALADHPLQVVVGFDQHEVGRLAIGRETHLDLKHVVAVKDTAQVLVGELKVLRRYSDSQRDHPQQVVLRRSLPGNRAIASPPSHRSVARARGRCRCVESLRVPKESVPSRANMPSRSSLRKPNLA